MSRFEELIETLIAGDRSGAAQPFSRDALAATLDLAERYARIEKKVLGSAKVVYSPTSLELASHTQDDALAWGELLARAERTRLDLQAGPILELARIIEEQGVKVLPRRFSPEYSGGFFFDEKLGPCILVPATENDSKLQYSLAHQYVHFVADYDPYITTLCGWPTAAALEDPIELRAHHAALALLMPRADLELYRDALGAKDAGALPDELVHQWQVYFELDPEQIFWRLLTLGWVDPDGLQRMLEKDATLAAELRSPTRVLSDQALLPERFVRLVACAFGSGKVDIGGAARLLGTDLEGAENILSQFEYEQPDATGSKVAKSTVTERRKRGNGHAPS